MRKISLKVLVCALISFSFSSVGAETIAAETTVWDTAEEGSPFSYIAYEGQYVKVKHLGETYYLITIDGVKTEDIFAACTVLYADDCQRLFAENFVQLLKQLAPAGTDWAEEDALNSVDLEFYFFATHRVTLFEEVAVTAENRNQVIIGRLLEGQ